jgi:hypothetical protein
MRAVAFVLAVLLGSSAAFADEVAAPPTSAPDAKEAIEIWPTLTPAGDAPGVAMHRPTDADGLIALRAQELDATLRDAAQDLGFEIPLGQAAVSPKGTRDTDILAHSGAGAGKWIVSPRIEAADNDTFLIRLVVAQPNARELRVRVMTVKGSEVSVKGLVMLRDALAPSSSAQAAKNDQDRERAGQLADLGSVPPPRSQGRAIFAVNGAVLGGFLAFSLQRASVNNIDNADDPRVLLPLLTLGTGVGLGGSLLAAEEWDVTTGAAWFLSAGTWWGAASGFFLASGTDVQPLNSRYLYGAAGGVAGLGLSVFALTRHSVDDGGALLTHSGGALGLYVGSVIELMVRGSFDRPPPIGQGVGAAVGVVGTGILATQIEISPSRVLLFDLGAGLGGLVGAAATSPLVFGTPTSSQTRVFLIAALSGSAIGGITAAFLTRTREPKKTAIWGEPVIGPIGSSATKEGPVPAYGLGWRGDW